jgi:hypothetical protein
MMLVPDGIAHRSTGSADALRWYFHLHEPVRAIYTADKETSRTDFTATRSGGPDWHIPADRHAAPKGQVIEQMIQWRDASAADYTRVARDYESLVGNTSRQRDKPDSLV